MEELVEALERELEVDVLERGAALDGEDADPDAAGGGVLMAYQRMLQTVQQGK